LHRIGRLPSVVGIIPVMIALREGAQTGAAAKTSQILAAQEPVIQRKHDGQHAL
jgi:hypothetical protein